MATTAGVKLVTVQKGQLVIGDDLANALNTRGEGHDVIGGDAIPPAQRLLVQDVQAYEVIGSSKAQSGDLPGATAALNQAVAILGSAQARGVRSVRLRARVLADLGDVDTDAGRPAAAVDHYDQAIKVLRIARHAGTSTEAGLLLDLGRAQLASGHEDLAWPVTPGRSSCSASPAARSAARPMRRSPISTCWWRAQARTPPS